MVAPLHRASSALLVLALAGALSGLGSQALAQAPTYITQWGSPGSGPGEFGVVHGISVNRAGEVYVADGGNCRIQRFSSIGAYLTELETLSPDCWLQGLMPGYVAVAPSGDVFVTNTEQVLKFTSEGAIAAHWGKSGTPDSRFDDPAGVAVDGSGNVYVSHRGWAEIRKFTSDGAFITGWALPESQSDGRYIRRARPCGIAVDPFDNVYVVDAAHSNVHKFNSSGVPLGVWGTEGAGDGQFLGVESVAVGPGGHIFVTDTGTPRVQVFTNEGVFLTKWGEYGSGPGQFARIQSIAIDSFGGIYVGDLGNTRVQKFGWTPVAARRTSWGQIKRQYR